MKLIKLADPKIRKNGKKRKRGVFECECGHVGEYDYYSIKAKKDPVCFSCSRKRAAIKMTKHGKMNHPLYRKWQDMKKRCYNKKVDRYKNYGALGITVCKEWRVDFLSFYNWSIENGWKENLELDRIDVTKNYNPSNCRFITHKEQGWNKRNTLYVKINGKDICLAEFMHKNNQSVSRYKNVWAGLKVGKTIDHYIDLYNLNTDI